MVFYQKYKPIPRLGQEELEKHWREIFENEGTIAANAWAENHFDDYTGLKVNEYLPRLRALCRAWNGVFWMNYFPADLRVAPKSTKAWRLLLANEARNAGIAFDGGHGQHPRWLVGGARTTQRQMPLWLRWRRIWKSGYAPSPTALMSTSSGKR